MTTPDNPGKRPSRHCKKKPTYEDVIESSSDEEPVKKKRRSSSDESFIVEEVKPKEPAKSRKKAVKATEQKQSKKKTTENVKTTRKRGAVKTEESSSIKVEHGEPEIPIKKIKIENPTDCQNEVSSFDSRNVKKEKFSDGCNILTESESTFTDQGCSTIKPEPGGTARQFTHEKSSDYNWYCDQCNGYNFQFRSVCYLCQNPKPRQYCGNWICQSSSCGSNNYSWRKTCYRCNLGKPDNDRPQNVVKPFFNKEEQKQDSFSSHSQPGQPFSSREGDWMCVNSKCGSNNFSWRKQCFRCQSEKPSDSDIYGRDTKKNILQNIDIPGYDCKPLPRHLNAGNDWVCANTNCGSRNFSWREQCFRCQAKRQNFAADDDGNGSNKKSQYFSAQKNQFEDKPPVVIKSEVLEAKETENVVKKEPLEESFRIESIEKVIAESSYKNLAPITETKKKAAVKKVTKKEVLVEEETKKEVLVKKENETEAPVKKETKKKGVVGKKTTKKEVCNLQNDEGISGANYKEINMQSSNEMNIHPNENQTTRECRLISKKSNVSFHIVLNLVNLFNSEATVPFIVRYRSHLTGGLSPEDIRMLKQRHESVKKLIDKADKMKKKLENLGYLDASLSSAIDSCVTQQELDYLNEPFKVLKSSKLVKVIDLGLSTPAENVLYGRGIVNLEQYVKEDLNVNEITDLIIYYVGEMMSKDSELMDRVRELMKTERIYLNSKQKTTTSKKAAEKVPKKNRPEDVYSNYYNFACPYYLIKPHQTLAINRGEAEHCLQVTLNVPDSFNYKICQFARKKWYWGAKYDNREFIFNKALEFMYSKRVCPYVKRLIRTELTKQGEKASLEVFSLNLKYLLLTQPVRNVTVCSVDPGFKNGCKIAILNPQQEVLETSVLYLDNPEHFVYKECMFVRLIDRFQVTLLVVGNGKGCREVELKISKLIEMGWLKRTLKYVVASENGISVYSCSADAAEEYPNISPNIISAISLAKRVQDPLCELVKVEPKHLGVGMYQHDLNEKKLESVLDDVVSECVSIVGVDVNNAPLRILKRVAGLSESRAKAVIDARENKGFINREDLKKVKGIGPKTFQQCAGFIKIIPGTCTKTKEKSKSGINYFDQTIIHPEDYSSSRKILEMNSLQPSQIGTPECIEKLKQFMESENLNSLATGLKIPFETVKLILEALTTPLDWDIRSTFDKPLFRNKVTSIDDLVVDTEMCGRVENVTHFGAFIDLGVECKGLIHIAKLHGKDLHLGQIVKVKIAEIDRIKMRISLLLVNVV